MKKRDTKCIFWYSDDDFKTSERCNNKTTLRGNYFGEKKESGEHIMPYIDFEFCQSCYELGLENNHVFGNVKPL